MSRITVFASSSPRTPALYLEQARRLGRDLAAAGHVLVNGAGREGCMGALNDACLAAGGTVHGVILDRFLDDGLAHPGLAELSVVDTMRERKRLLGETSEAYIVLPGGPGTWEEFWEVVVERQIGVHDRPVVLVDINGFYSGFLAQTDRADLDGLLYGEVAQLYLVADDVDDALDMIEATLAGEPMAGGRGGLGTETADSLHFFQELIAFMIATGTRSYRIPAIDIPVNLASSQIRAARYHKIIKVLDWYAPVDKDLDGPWRMLFMDQESEREFRFSVRNDGNGLLVEMEPL